MKNLQCALNADLKNMLERQAEMEHNMSAQYLIMASWADRQGYTNSSSFLYEQSEEERAHMLRIIHYINERGAHALAPTELTITKDSFTSLKDVFLCALEYEVKTTKAIHNLVDYCFKEKDFTTFEFLRWFLVEQIEEEAIARKQLQLFDIMKGPEERLHIFLIDKEIKKIKKEYKNLA